MKEKQLELNLESFDVFNKDNAKLIRGLQSSIDKIEAAKDEFIQSLCNLQLVVASTKAPKKEKVTKCIQRKRSKTTKKSSSLASRNAPDSSTEKRLRYQIWLAIAALAKKQRRSIHSLWVQKYEELRQATGFDAFAEAEKRKIRPIKAVCTSDLGARFLDIIGPTR